VTRIVAGAARGRRLAVPPGDTTRPTSDRAREGLFGTLESLHGHLYGARVLDLYAGTGAVGLEALSRGASAVTLVESAPGPLTALRANVDAVRLAGAEVLARPVAAVLAAGPGPRLAYDIVFSDPPYALDDAALRADLEALLVAGWLAPAAVVAVERSSKGPAPDWPARLRPARERRYGEAVIHYAVQAVDAEGSA
jgi:16S rRNA (guanine966-N2)-methyltransferase